MQSACIADPAARCGSLEGASGEGASGVTSNPGGDGPPPADPAADEAAAQVAYDAFVRRHLPRNYAAHFVHGMLGMTGFRLINAPTFVPSYLHSISGSDAWVGLGIALQQLGGMATPILGANQIEHRKRILPVSVTLGLMMRAQILGLALCAWFLAGGVETAVALILLFLLGFFQGPQRVAFQYLMSKVIPVDLRGRLNAWRNAIGGLIAAGLSWVAGDWLVANQVLGDGFATTFLASFVLTSLGLSALQILMLEPEPPTARVRASLVDRLRDVPRLLTSDRGFAWFMVARSIAMGSRIALPFYFLHAAEVMGVSADDDALAFGRVLALLSAVFMGADVLASLVWGYLADRSGFKSTLTLSMGLSVIGVGLMLVAGDFWMFVAAFFLISWAQSGYFLSTTNIVLEYGHSHDVPMRMAISNTAEGLVGALAPLIGGGLAAIWGYPAAFVATLACSAVALALTIWKVEEPRRRRVAGEAPTADP
jgi:MFS family permease